MTRLLGFLALIAIAGQMTAPDGHATYLSLGGKIPLWLKIVHTLFLCVLVPAYWIHYGPANFLWFSDIALLATLAALWLESRLLASMQAVSVALLELAWLVDFLIALVTGVSVLGISGYMFKPEIPLFIRGLSLFHVWLPFLLVWLVWRLGYDRRAWLCQSLLALVVLPVTYWLTDPKDNVNWVHGLGRPQTALPPWTYLAVLILAFSLVLYLPPHLAFSYLPLSVMSS